MECKIIFERNIKGFKKHSEYYGEIKRFFPINYIPVETALFDFLVKCSTEYRFLFEESHPFGAFERNSALKISKCILKVENKLFCVEEKLDIRRDYQIDRYCSINEDLGVTGFNFIEDFIKYLTKKAKHLLGSTIL